jgi:hypothetical protein
MLRHAYVQRNTSRAAVAPACAARHPKLGQRLGNRGLTLLARAAKQYHLAAERLDEQPTQARAHTAERAETGMANARFTAAPVDGMLARQGERAPERRECTPAPGLTPSNCSAYLAHAWWLPLAYINNATCACQETPNEPTANCVRKFLQDRLAATPGWVKAMAAIQKPNENIPAMYPSYQAFVQAFLTPRIYADHVDAYAHCCCPSGPAPYPAWIGVTTVPMPCAAVGWSIRQYGSCHGTPGAW